jgi:hypothetical protein
MTIKAQQLRELAGKATPGPFEAIYAGYGSFSDTVIRRCGSEKIASLEWRWFDDTDGQLIAQLLNNLPTILTALELQERLDKPEMVEAVARAIHTDHMINGRAFNCWSWEETGQSYYYSHAKSVLAAMKGATK